jgi:hypothetical protein
VKRGLPTRTPPIASVTLIAVGAVLLFVGVLALYLRDEVIDQESFANRAVEAVADEQVRTVVSRELVVNLVDRGSSDLIAARPLIESVVNAAIDTDAFRKLFREAALETNRVLFVRDRDNAAFRIADAYRLVRFGLRSVAPQVAADVPTNLDVALLKLKRRDFATQTLAFADGIRVLGIVLPVAALLAFAAAIALARDRRVAVMRMGVAVGAVGAVLVIAMLIVRARLLANVFGEDELTNEDVRGAVGGILDAFFGDLFILALALGLAGVIIAAVAAALDPVQVKDPAARVRHWAQKPPATNWGRGLRAAAGLALGVAILVNPSLALRVVAVLAGAYLIYLALIELLLLAQLGARRSEEEVQRRRWSFAAAGAVGAVAVAALAALALVLTGKETEAPGGTVSTAGACNGSAGMCSLRLDEAVFAGTHNSFSAADSPGWFIANQRRTIDRQLQDGIRLFLLDPHWGVAGQGGRVRTDFESEGRDRNRVAAALPPKTLKAAERVAGSIGLRPGEKGEREVWLCHTVCELGGTPMNDTLTTMREFLDRNPGEVLILFLEPYVPPEDIASVFADTGLERYVVTLDPDKPLPTLGELVRTNRRVIVFTERDADGSVPWYLDGFSFVQDTPLGATKPSELSCALNRGTRRSPLLMLNHWADVFPPKRSANAAFLRKGFIVRRAHQCARRRGQPVNLIATDHYDEGDLIGAVKTLNRERVAAVRRAGNAGRG